MTERELLMWGHQAEAIASTGGKRAHDGAKAPYVGTPSGGDSLHRWKRRGGPLLVYIFMVDVKT